MRSWEEINEYYNSLNIKSYWRPESMSLYNVNIITFTFDMLHAEYPKVVIKEIGDYYSEAKIKHEKSIESIKRMLNDIDSNGSKIYVHYKDKPKDKQLAIDNLKKILEEPNEEEISISYDKNGKNYFDYDHDAIYFSGDQKILFNHQKQFNYGAAMIHEFGHAIAFQYDLNENNRIRDVFDKYGRYNIDAYISVVASTDIEEFIAEAFERYYCNNYHIDIADDLKKVLDEEVEVGIPGTNTEIAIRKILNNKN